MARTASQARSAWATRSKVISVEGRGADARRFLALARQHDREKYTVAEVAATLGMGVRRLSRLCVSVFGYSPGIVLSLLRVHGVVLAIARREMTLEVIAEEHGYPNRGALARQFRRFVGVSPGAYRVRLGADRVGRPRTVLSETALPKASRWSYMYKQPNLRA